MFNSYLIGVHFSFIHSIKAIKRSDEHGTIFFGVKGCNTIMHQRIYVAVVMLMFYHSAGSSMPFRIYNIYAAIHRTDPKPAFVILAKRSDKIIGNCIFIMLIPL